MNKHQIAEVMKELGRRSIAAQKKKYGAKYSQEMSRRGVQSNLKSPRPLEYYKKLSKMGVKARWKGHKKLST